MTELSVKTARYVEPKGNGWWGEIHIVQHNYVILSKNGVVLETGNTDLPDAILYAEAMIGTEWSRRFAGAFMCFDIHVPGTYGERREALDLYLRGGDGRPPVDAFDDSSSLPTPNAMAPLRQRLWQLPSRRLDADKSTIQIADWVQRARVRGWEGVIHKTDDTPPGGYEGKTKFVQDVDLVVMEVNMSPSPFMVGQVASFTLGAYKTDETLVEVCRCGILPPPERRAAYLDPSAPVGRVIEVHHDGRTSRGSYQVARFSRWRDDKAAADVTLAGLS